MKPIVSVVIMFLHFFQLPSFLKGQALSSIHQFSANGMDGQVLSLANFKGKKMLIVNTASKCGLTPQFKQLQKLHATYKDKGLIIIGFPSNDFAKQDPGNNAEIKDFCERNYGVTFLMMEKIVVKGEAQHPIYRWLTSKTENGVMRSKVTWNFQKYLIDEDGHLVDMVSPWKHADCRRIIRWLTKNK